MEGDEIEWVRQAREGDHAAFDRLVRLHEVRLLGRISSILGGGPEVYDVYQDTLVQVYRKLPTFRGESSFLTWATRIAMNRALNERRRRRPQRRASLAEADALPSGDGAGVADGLDREQLRLRTDQAMEVLSERERTVFLLKHRHGLKLREIGTMLGCAEGTVKNYLFRATRKLRTRLEPLYRELKG